MLTELDNGRLSRPHGPRRIAVIGSGVAGLSAAWLLSQSHRVTLYEADNRLGGHSNTVMAETGKTMTPVDTGFIVFNARNYPNLVALFDHLGVATEETNMTFSASLDGGKLEYSSDGLNGLVGQRGNMINPRFWGMVRDILRFYREAPGLLKRAEAGRLTLGDYLDANNYSEAFVEDHLLPMGAAIWSTTAAQMRAYPLDAFIRFFANHGLMTIIGRPLWRTVTGGSRVYVQKMLNAVAEVRRGAAVTEIRRGMNQVTVRDANGDSARYDDVVIASHADQALAMLHDADDEERALLGAFTYTDNLAVLHRDVSLMPKRKRVWGSWNYVGESSDTGERPLCVTYWMNKLQNLDRTHPLFVTLNPTRPIAEGQMIQSIGYSHPLFDHKAIAAQRELWRLQGRGNVYFAGSYFGSGFHEDALQSGLAAAEAVGGVRRPWRVANESGRITLAPMAVAAE
ncbi:MAG: FAD-dependent oxidoreductase [Devosia sp.]